MILKTAESLGLYKLRKGKERENLLPELREQMELAEIVTNRSWLLP